ncbi:polysaccharide biosynthesis/export family protein [Pseudomonas huanghezhanensis]|uniref:polysaccharide biosynthesis/export family protein n=1 Tax=Pseudomonas huanghezhanensis TaxID=3002903 RepID=UPI0022859245|nr:polysaccharide biosynthesis/export family protein [Pseudomonas sp. BSw22131]
MIIRTFRRLFLGVFIMFIGQHGAYAAGNSEYKLGSGDVISINVYGEDDMSFKSLRLTDAGTFSYPFIGEVNAKGKTASEIEALLVSELKGDYLVNPRVSVNVLQYREFYIGGEVKTPGGYPFQPGLTVRRAVALAGGFTERASEGKISINRDLSATPVEKASLDALVSPGDTITVPQGFF